MSGVLGEHTSIIAKTMKMAIISGLLPLSNSREYEIPYVNIHQSNI